MNYRRAMIVLLVVLLTAGCGLLSQNTEAPADATLPTAPAPVPILPEDTVSPTDVPATDVPPTAIPQDDTLAYRAVLASPTDLQIEVPDSWISAGTDAVWVSMPGDASRVGVTRADLAPPAEAEAVLLPEGAQILESWTVKTPLGEGRQFRLEVYGAAPQGDDVKADVASVEMHVLVVVTEDGQRTGYSFYAAAPTAEMLDTVLPVLSRVVETARIEVPVAPPESGSDDIPAVANAKARLAQHLSIEAGTIRVVSAEAVDWADACIGIHATGQMCAQVITPGYRIMADVGGQSYELHTNASGSVVGIVP